MQSEETAFVCRLTVAGHAIHKLLIPWGPRQVPVYALRDVAHATYLNLE